MLDEIDDCIFYCLQRLQKGKSNPVRINIPQDFSQKTINETIDKFRKTFPKVLISCRIPRYLSFFIPKGFSCRNFEEKNFSIHSDAAFFANNIANDPDPSEENKYTFIICPIVDKKIPADIPEIPDCNIDPAENIEDHDTFHPKCEYSEHDRRRYMKRFTSLIMDKLRQNHPKYQIGIPHMKFACQHMDFDEFSPCVSYDTMDYYLWFK